MYCIYEELKKIITASGKTQVSSFPPSIVLSFWGLSIISVCLKNTSKTVSQMACLADTQDNTGNV